MFRPVLFDVPDCLAERVVMDQESGLTADPECGSILARRPVLSLVGSPSAALPLLDRGRLIEAIGESEGTIVRMRLDPKMQRFFPERHRESRSSFLRFFRAFEHEVCLEETSVWPAVRLPRHRALAFF